MPRVIAAYANYVMAHNHLHRRNLTLQQAVEEVVTDVEEDATDVEEDEDVSRKNDLLSNDVAGTLEIHNEHYDKENKVVSDSRAIQIEGKTSQPPSKRRLQ